MLNVSMLFNFLYTVYSGSGHGYAIVKWHDDIIELTIQWYVYKVCQFSFFNIFKFLMKYHSQYVFPGIEHEKLVTAFLSTVVYLLFRYPSGYCL